ncbi:MAG: MaoC family dehydratase [Methyloligellaceae bacterium]
MNNSSSRTLKRAPKPTRYFEDFNVGEKYIIPSRTMTSGLFAMFQAASGDNDPIHYDVEYCRERGHKDMLAHGMQVLIQSAAGAGEFPSQVADSLIGMVELEAKFLGPVYRGDTLYPELEIVDLFSQNSTGVIVMKASIHNQADNLVFEGSHRYLVRKRKKN